MSSTLTFVYALIGGLIPALLWLAFWLQEDREHPEPRRRIIKVFLAGMLSVPIVFFIQLKLAPFLLDGQPIQNLFDLTLGSALLIITALAATEEIVKYLAARYAALTSSDNDEATDPIIYMIVAALGFAAMENGLYLVAPLISEGLSSPFVEANWRFIGATLVHVSCSAIVGMFIAFTSFSFRRYKVVATLCALVFATGLHAIYNLFIITNAQYRMIAFMLIWSVCVALIIIFEKVKSIHLNNIISEPPHEKA